MIADKFFPQRSHAWHLNAGQAQMFDDQAGRRAFVREGYPPFEPCEDGYYASHGIVEQVRALVSLFDAVGGIGGPQTGEVLASNLFLLADLAGAAALHVRRSIDAEAEVERTLCERWNAQAIDDLRHMIVEMT